jgi:outer membrane biosynthesis protein TonB
MSAAFRTRHRPVAFESFRMQEERLPRRQRNICFALVAIFHGALIAAGVAYSYWDVEELTPPGLRVTFISMAPSLPPTPEAAGGRAGAKKLAPPPPAGGHVIGRKVAIKTKVSEPVTPPLAAIVTPPEKPMPLKKAFSQHEHDAADNAKSSAGADVRRDSIDGEEFGEDHGVKGGVKGGTVGGKIGGVAAPEGPRSVSPQVGSLQKESGNMPPFPSSLMHGKMVYVVETKICISTTGAVDSVTITRRSDTELDASVSNTLKAWRYRPMTLNNTAVAFCYPVRFEFRSES